MNYYQLLKNQIEIEINRLTLSAYTPGMEYSGLFVEYLYDGIVRVYDDYGGGDYKAEDLLPILRNLEPEDVGSVEDIWDLIETAEVKSYKD
ncbi:hypothetical protein [Myxosarcina sp. GI1(2024)]